MTLKLFNIAQILSTPSIVYNVTNTNTNLDINEYNKYSRLVTNFVNEESELVNKISEKMDMNKSAKQNIESINEEDKEKLFDLLSNKMVKENLIDSNKQIEIKNDLALKKELDKKFHRIFVETIKDVRLQNSNIKKEVKSYYKRIITDAKNKYAVNDDGVESSKNIENKIISLVEMSNLLENSILHQINTAKNLKIASSVFFGLSAVAAATASILYAVSFFTAGLTAPIAAGLTVAASFLGAAAFLLRAISDSIMLQIQEYTEIKEIISKYKNWKLKDIALNLAKYFIKLKSGIKNIKLMLKNVLPKPKHPAFGLISSAFSIKNMLQDIDQVELLDKINEEIANKIDNLNTTISNMKSVKWIVINETPLDKPYIEGGSGGINTHFKNLETGEIKTLEELLKLSDFELSTQGLLRVKHPKTGYYLKTFPNKFKWDNLG